jgi:hypothetical protein
MVSSEPGASQVTLSKLNATQPILVITLGVLVFLLCDNLIFRTGVYQQISSPDPFTGRLFYSINFMNKLPPAEKKDILLTGASKMEVGFWVRLFEEENPKSSLRFIQGAVVAANAEWTYFILKLIDPKLDRYTAIIIPVEGYKINAWSKDEGNDFATAQGFAPLLNPWDWSEILAGYSDAAVSRKAMLSFLICSHTFALDVQDLILRPFARIESVAQRKKIGARWMYDDPGGSESVEGLVIDQAAGRVTKYPDHFNVFERKYADEFVRRPSLEDAELYTARNAAFRIYWLRKIVDRYRESQTKLIFLQIPRWPFPLPAFESLPSAPDLRVAIPAGGNVVFLDENAFSSLESPEYFGELLHFNAAGRRRFTEMLGQSVQRVLATE